MSVSMRDLPVLPMNSDYQEQFGGKKWCFPIAIVFLKERQRVGWRGVGQRIPESDLIGIGYLWFAGGDEFDTEEPSEGVPDDFHPIFVEVNCDLDERWDRLVWEDNSIHWRTDRFGRVVGASMAYPR